jgi:hypothetical protein
MSEQVQYNDVEQIEDSVHSSTTCVEKNGNCDNVNISHPVIDTVIPLAANIMSTIFGPDALIVGDKIKDIIDNNVSSNSSTTKTVTYCLAPSFGKLTKDTLQEMDNNLKVMIAGTIKDIQKESALLPGNTTLEWDDIVRIFSNNPFIELDDTSVPIFIDQTYSKKSTDYFKTDGSPDMDTVDEVEHWFKSVIADEDIINATSIRDEVLLDIAKLVCETGAHVDTFEDIISKTTYDEKSLIDIGVLRFPDISHPFMKIYRIKLRAFRKCERLFFCETNSSGLRVIMSSRKYKPKDSVINNLSKDLISKAVSACNSMFD